MVHPRSMRFEGLLGHTFSAQLLASVKSPVVVDCGSNRGEFARACRDRFGADLPPLLSPQFTQ
jgi:hypothetical protein